MVTTSCNFEGVVMMNYNKFEIELIDLNEELRELELSNWSNKHNFAASHPDYYARYQILKENCLKSISPNLYFQIADTGMYLFPFCLKSVFLYIFNIDDSKEQLEILKQLNEMEVSYLESGEEWKEIGASLLMYLTFRSSSRHKVHGLRRDAALELINFSCHVNNIQLNMELIWKHVDKLSLNKVTTEQEYYSCESAIALEILVCSGDKEAFNLYYQTTKRIYDNTGEVHSCLDANISSFLHSIGYDEQRRKFLFRIWHRWERICFEIAQNKFDKVIQHPILPNGTIPDLMPILNEFSVTDILDHIPVLIECKKTLYFTDNKKSDDQDFFNNETVKNYLPYCDKLCFWVMEKTEYDDLEPLSQLDASSKIQYTFAEDFLEMNLPDKLKNKIKRVLFRYFSYIRHGD